MDSAMVANVFCKVATEGAKCGTVLVAIASAIHSVPLDAHSSILAHMTAPVVQYLSVSMASRVAKTLALRYVGTGPEQRRRRILTKSSVELFQTNFRVTSLCRHKWAI